MASEGSAVENTARRPSAVRGSLAVARSARLLGKPARARAHCHRATMPTISASLSAASIEGHVHSSGRSILNLARRRGVPSRAPGRAPPVFNHRLSVYLTDCDQRPHTYAGLPLLQHARSWRVVQSRFQKRPWRTTSRRPSRRRRRRRPRRPRSARSSSPRSSRRAVHPRVQTAPSSHFFVAALRCALQDPLVLPLRALR